MTIKEFLSFIFLICCSLGVAAQTSTGPAGDFYTIQLDYRLCPAPTCGGWWLTKVNQYTVKPSDELLSGSITPIIPNPIHVTKIDYTALHLKPSQILVFENNIGAGRAFIRGVVAPYTVQNYPTNLLKATGTWLAVNDTVASGPYMNVRSTGIVCITTPCPYYEAQLLNIGYRTLVHELDLKRAELTDKQLQVAWNEVSGKGLIMTGLRYSSQGQTGSGLGVAATRVFFTFPGPLDGY
jgi:hypothetical protein